MVQMSLPSAGSAGAVAIECALTRGCTCRLRVGEGILIDQSRSQVSRKPVRRTYKPLPLT